MAFKKVLVVDDDEMVRFLIKYMISQTGLSDEVAFAQDGEKALAMVQKEHFSLILLDLNMPIMNGFEFLKAVTQLNAIDNRFLPPIFVLSSSVDSKDMETALSYPIVKGFFSKPFSREHAESLLKIYPGSSAKKEKQQNKAL